MNLEITITFLDYWHCGSGDSGGNESDALVVKYEKGEKKGLPYVPAKTLKGLIREMVEANENIDCKDIQEWFGNTSDKTNKCYEKDEIKETDTHFGNANIVGDIDEKNIPYLFKTFKSTALENGIAKGKSLREIEAVIPLELKGIIDGMECDNEKKKEALKNAIKSIKRIGLSRNRGFGRCEVTVVEANDEKA